MKFLFQRLENIVGKGENGDYMQFFPLKSLIKVIRSQDYLVKT